ncbi:nickel insertion protein, partial [Paucilactobacillus nenjiangensis]|uniref:nickel insertion protein n=1 Tax=Paucilactobacillus nenjiangensis TaxID=1296540 RepID=UPI003BB67113
NKNYDIQKIGYGFGKRDTGSFNALRVYVLTNSLSSKTAVSSADEVVSIEANIDDTTGEILGNTMTELMDAGALDVYFTSIQMKKNRPGIKLSVLIEPTDFDKFVYLIFKNSSTIGVRYQTLNRIKMNREFEKVEVRGNFIRVKVLTYKDIRKKTVEFDDCLKVAKQTGRTFEEIYLEAQTKIKDM